MRYIQKLETPVFFIDNTDYLQSWSNYKSSHKRIVKKYILDNEQNNLCCYCESRVNIDNSHIEHIKPKSLYPKLIFNYRNLSISCQGTCHNQEGDNTLYNCGHNKSNDYNENLFLNPTLIEDISEYFEYEDYIQDSIKQIKIKESTKDITKAQYMLGILNLNDDNTTITKARYLELVKFENMIVEFDLTAMQVDNLLDDGDMPFVSLLRYKYPKSKILRA